MSFTRLMTAFVPPFIAIALMSTTASAIITSTSFDWSPEPDAWARGNTADISYFGWDALEVGTPPRPMYGGLRVLDDSTPDLGVGTTATGTRIYQGNNGVLDYLTSTSNGHRSGSMNYYSFFDEANDTITGTAPASGVGGYTTIVLQMLENVPSDGLQDINFSIDTSTVAWSLDKNLHDVYPRGRGARWVEWSAPGNDLAFKINFTSTALHRAIDGFQIDTYWTPGAVPVLNSRNSAIPEPTSAVLAVVGLIGGLASMRRRNG